MFQRQAAKDKSTLSDTARIIKTLPHVHSDDDFVEINLVEEKVHVPITEFVLDEMGLAAFINMYAGNERFDEKYAEEKCNQFLTDRNITKNSLEAKELKEAIRLQLDSIKCREYILRREIEGFIEHLKSYQDNPAVLQKLIFSKGRTDEKFGENKEFTRIHEGKSAWELMIWTHNYDLFFKPLKVFVEIADPTKELAKSQTPLYLLGLQHLNSEMTVATSSAAVTHSGKDEKQDEATQLFDFESLVKAILADPCTDNQATTPALIHKLEEFKNACLTTGELSPLQFPNVQVLQQAYQAYFAKFSDLSLEQVRVFGRLVIDPLVFSLPSGFNHHVHYYNEEYYNNGKNPMRIQIRSSFVGRDHWSVIAEEAGKQLMQLCQCEIASFNQLLNWVRSPSAQVRDVISGSPRPF
jgi:hypothetical protein